VAGIDTPAHGAALTRRWAGSLLGHGLLALGLGLAAYGADALPPDWHLGAGIGASVLIALALAWRVARPSPPSGLALLDGSVPLLRLALALAVAALAGTGLLFSDPTWAVRSITHDLHEGLAAVAAGLLALHALAEWAALAWVTTRRPAAAAAIAP
jgi:hypothetical protein